MMLELARWSLSELPLFGVTAWAASSNHIRFHHTYYARGHLVSSTYHGDDGCVS